MCQWGDEELVEVTIVADLSCTGQAKRKSVGIDRCIAPIVRALDAAGIEMTASCCGHGKGPAQIDLADGRILTIREA